MGKKVEITAIARNRNLAVLFSGINTSLAKQKLDDINHQLAESISKLYGSTVYPMNFYFNDKIDYKAIYLCGMKSIDTVILIDGEIKTPLRTDIFTYRGYLRLLNPSTFREIVNFPLLITSKDYRSLDSIDEDATREQKKQQKEDRLAFLLERKVLRGLKTILPDPNNYPRLNLVQLADLLFEEKQFEYAQDLYKRHQEEVRDELDLATTIKLANNLKVCKEELKNAKEKQVGYSFGVDVNNVKEQYRALLKGIILESYIEQEIGLYTTAPATLGVDYDDIFNKCLLTLTIQYGQEFYLQNLPKFQVPETYKERKVLGLMIYRNLFKELLLLKRNIAKKIQVMSPEKRLTFDISLTLINFNRRIVLGIEDQEVDDDDLAFPIELRLINQDKQWYTLKSLFPTVTAQRGLFVLDNAHDDRGQLSPSGMAYEFFYQ
ncbi:MAG: hypothetical protein A2284_14460 [Deltaproteobacteria bacterium RIFOXYA12_FULL_61_11]|nr:MAG: hypothetical protein A2284_14460 [Deltaproteobacteria bacterium RIFOXYA12_FULL_61_11]